VNERPISNFQYRRLTYHVDAEVGQAKHLTLRHQVLGRKLAEGQDLVQLRVRHAFSRQSVPLPKCARWTWHNRLRGRLRVALRPKQALGSGVSAALFYK
jgi:hypothetical protein